MVREELKQNLINIDIASLNKKCKHSVYLCHDEVKDGEIPFIAVFFRKHDWVLDDIVQEGNISRAIISPKTYKIRDIVLCLSTN